MKVIEELMEDFGEAVEKIDFDSYNPTSEEFDRALRIGMMLHLVATYCDHEHADIYEELADSEKYSQLFKETGNETYKKMAEDEMNHAQMLMKISAQKDDERPKPSAPPTSVLPKPPAL